MGKFLDIFKKNNAESDVPEEVTEVSEDKDLMDDLMDSADAHDVKDEPSDTEIIDSFTDEIDRILGTEDHAKPDDYVDASDVQSSEELSNSIFFGKVDQKQTEESEAPVSGGTEVFDLDAQKHEDKSEPEEPEKSEEDDYFTVFNTTDDEPADYDEPEEHADDEPVEEADESEKADDQAEEEDEYEDETPRERRKRLKWEKRHNRSIFAKIAIALLKLILLVMCLGVIGGCALGVMGSVYVVNQTANDEELLDLNQIKLSYSTRLMAFDQESGEWHEYQRIYGDQNRIWVDYVDMPKCLIDATVASEDVRFWQHHGVDWKRTAAAFINFLPGIDLFSTNQGGSTIYQQLIKNITDERDSSGMAGALRKLTEIYRALIMDKRFSKEQVLEAYLNTISLSGTLAGVESAANYYFGKTTADLTAAESAAIVCVTKYPTHYNPITHHTENKSQRDQILWTMHEQGWLTDAEYARAQAESDAMVFEESDYVSDSEKTWSWFTDVVVAEVITDLQKYNGLTQAEAYDMFYNGGLTVYITIDERIQGIMDDAIAYEALPDEEAPDKIWPELTHTRLDGNEEPLEGSMLLMNYQGELLALEGSMYPKEVSLAFNRASGPIGNVLEGALRQTGSTMKPISTYAPALDQDKIHYSKLFPDEPIQTVIDGRTTNWPRNYSNTYGNPVTVNVALRQSLNTVAVRIMHYLVYPDYSFDFMKNFLGLTHLQDSVYDEVAGGYISDRGDGIALGSLTYGESLYEMVAAYQIFGNGGVFTEGHSYRYVEDSKGNVVLDKLSKLKVTQAISEDTAYIMNRLLREVMRNGTGYYAQYGNMPLAAKSGTTSDNNDIWFIGMNPYYVMGVWKGFDEPDYIRNYRPHRTQLMWKKIMSQVSEPLEDIDFPVSDNVVVRTYCYYSGDLAGEICGNCGTGYYKRTYIPYTCDGVADTEAAIRAALEAAGAA